MKSDTFADTLYKAFRREYTGYQAFDDYIEKIIHKQDLSAEEACVAMRILISGQASEFQQGAFLTAMYKKSPAVDEIAAFAYTLRKLATPIKVKTGKIGIFGKAAIGDTCGTGGGPLETFNVSTAIMFILASAGIIIAKHGNRAITSKCGSADVLEELGVNINLEPKQVEECISKIGIGFIYAPNFHKAFKNVQKIRKELPFPTIFNILGPLANPAFTLDGDNRQVLGVNKPELVEIMAEVLKRLKVKRAIVVHGYFNGHKSGMDEISTVGETKVSELKEDGTIDNYLITPEQFGLKRANPEDLVGGEASKNAKILVNILKGEKGPKRDLVLLNAAAGLYVGDKAKNIKEGIKIAEKEIDSFRAYRKLEELIKFSTEV
ncbi:MAG: anthranilate phosphoribosyltransferase [Candidatus Omnitrophica bacterium]|nr:anthranilate phosphoribosyltransferase [Candidatus Omnitrophota bacterium]MBU4457953.1 anthranilate phosphoribosyltransferase [Candidatus Omnitrophota bacterium]